MIILVSRDMFSWPTDRRLRYHPMNSHNDVIIRIIHREGVVWCEGDVQSRESITSKWCALQSWLIVQTVQRIPVSLCTVCWQIQRPPWYNNFIKVSMFGIDILYDYRRCSIGSLVGSIAYCYQCIVLSSASTRARSSPTIYSDVSGTTWTGLGYSVIEEGAWGSR